MTISRTPDPMPFMGVAMSAFPPSAAIVRADRQMDCASSGNSPKSFRAAFIHEIGRVFRVIRPTAQHHKLMLSYLTTTVNGSVALTSSSDTGRINQQHRCAPGLNRLPGRD